MSKQTTKKKVMTGTKQIDANCLHQINDQQKSRKCILIIASRRKYISLLYSFFSYRL